MEKQKVFYESGNELAAYAAKQINYHVMGYYPITPSTQIAENLDIMKAQGEHDIRLIAAEGEHSAAGICYGASAGGGRVFNATSANGLLYALEQFPVQSGTRFPMVMNVACRTVSGPLCIKGDHSDIMYMLNTGWIILFADQPQMVYDLNIIALKLAEAVSLPVVVAFDGFFTSHQKRKCMVFEDDSVVQRFIGKKPESYSVLNLEEPVSIGSYMNEQDIMNNKYQLHLAMEDARTQLPHLFEQYGELSGRHYACCDAYQWEDAEILLFVLGSSYETAKEAIDFLRKTDMKVGAVTLHVLRPFPGKILANYCKNASTIIACDRQDSYGAGGGNISLELRAALQSYYSGEAMESNSSSGEENEAIANSDCADSKIPKVITRIYGLGGKDFYMEDAIALIQEAMKKDVKEFDYYGITLGTCESDCTASSDFINTHSSSDTLDTHSHHHIKQPQYFQAFSTEELCPGITSCTYDEQSKKMIVSGGTVKATTGMPKRIAPGHGACPGCGIPVNLNFLLKGIEGNVVLLLQTGCGMVVTTGYPKTSYRIPHIHNLFQNGAATLSGVEEVFRERQQRGEYPEGDITFVMVSGDGGMDIGMGSALGTALRNQHLIIFEYDNGGYMNTGYQLSYSTPKGARSSTSHIGKDQYGKTFFHKDTPEIMAATHIPYVATVAESNPADFIRKAAKAAAYSRDFGTAYVKALSACPLNWNDKPNLERSVIAAAVDCCYFPLYEVEQGITTVNYNPVVQNKKIPVMDWFKMMGRTKHLAKEAYASVVNDIQCEVDRRFARLLAKSENPLL